MTILDRIMEINSDPKQFVITGKVITDDELNIKVLGKSVEEDADGWWIKHNGKYVIYCAKKSKAMPEHNDDPLNLEACMVELWGRFTRKKLNPNVDYGYRV